MDMIVSAKPDQLYNNSCGEHGGRPPRGFVPSSHAAAAEFFALFYRHCMPPTAQPRVLMEVRFVLLHGCSLARARTSRS